MFWLAYIVFALIIVSPARAQSPAHLIRLSAESIGSSNSAEFSEAVRAWVASEGRAEIAKLQTVGPITKIVDTDSYFASDLWLTVGRAEHARGISDWKIIVSTAENKVVRVSLKVTLAGETSPLPPTIDLRGPESVPPQAICATFPRSCGSASVSPDSRAVEFLFATTREKATAPGRTSYSGERGQRLSLGAARVRIPEDHRIGKIELPSSIQILTVSLYEFKANPEKHFVIQGTKDLTPEEWQAAIREKNSDEALIFVHGYNTSFDESLYRMAQVVWDLQYPGLPILFSWPSRGGVLNYIYDQQSALGARDSFVAFLQELRRSGPVKRVHIIAHSMGNFLVLEALAALSQDASALQVTAGIAELIMAAPDVDRDYFAGISGKIARVASGLTLYASSADKAMVASRSLAGVPRAGDVPKDGPLIRPGVETIDVTALGDDVFGLNHDVFATSRSVINDIGILISSAPRRLPHLRLHEMRRVPEFADAPRYWRYSN